MDQKLSTIQGDICGFAEYGQTTATPHSSAQPASVREQREQLIDAKMVKCYVKYPTKGKVFKKGKKERKNRRKKESNCSSTSEIKGLFLLFQKYNSNTTI